MAQKNTKIVDPGLTPFIIRISDYSCDVVEEAVSEGGREHEIPRGYFSNISGAIKKIARLKAERELPETVNLKQYLERYEKIVVSLENIAKI